MRTISVIFLEYLFKYGVKLQFFTSNFSNCRWQHEVAGCVGDFVQPMRSAISNMGLIKMRIFSLSLFRLAEVCGVLQLFLHAISCTFDDNTKSLGVLATSFNQCAAPYLIRDWEKWEYSLFFCVDLLKCVEYCNFFYMRFHALSMITRSRWVCWRLRSTNARCHI